MNGSKSHLISIKKTPLCKGFWNSVAETGQRPNTYISYCILQYYNLTCQEYQGQERQGKTEELSQIGGDCATKATMTAKGNAGYWIGS